MTGDRWTDSDDAQFAFAALPDAHPVKLTAGIWDALRSEEDHTDLVLGFVTPESRELWGDFDEVRRAFRSEDLSLLGTARQYAGALDVAYVWLLAGSGPARMTNGPEVTTVRYTFTWVWRPEEGGWRLHGIGAPVPVDEVPRTSPNVAPGIDSIPPRYLGPA